jgi:hypothetical protein
MKSTTDYSIFKDFSSNREVDPKHVKKLVRAIAKRNLLKVNPIVCDEFMRVIDGQHRLEAAKILGVEIFYITDNINRGDISMLNSNQKNWTAMDYINFYTVEKVNSFIQLSSLINNNPKMAISALITLSSSEGKRDIIELKEGHLDIEEIESAKEICAICNDLFARFEADFVYDSRFPLALGKTIKCEGFKMELLIGKIEAAPRSFVRCHTKRQYLEMIEEIYNRNLSKNKIRLT